MAHTEDDRDLFVRVVARDQVSLGVLYERYAGVIFALLLRIVGNRQVAEELLQETFFQVWRGAATYDAARGGVASWLLTIARNRGIDELRRRAREPHLAPPSEQTERELERATNATDEIAAHGSAIARHAAVVQALEQLPGVQRAALELAYFEGLSQTEIATRLQEPLGTVKTRVRLGLRKLREIMDGINPSDLID